MATTSVWTAVLTLSGDDPATKVYTAAANTTSPAQDDFVNLASGANTITAPVAATPTRLTIVPPAGNANLLTLKGVSGDAGIPLHKTDPTSVALNSTVTTLVINAADTTLGVRLIWS